MEDYILKLDGISKSFPGVKALQNVSFQVRRGDIHGLVGENGAGKSTLIKILCGVYTADGGQVTFKGARLSPKNPLDAQMQGISVVHQELKLVESLTVMENIFLGRPPVGKAGLVKMCIRDRPRSRRYRKSGPGRAGTRTRPGYSWTSS